MIAWRALPAVLVVAACVPPSWNEIPQGGLPGPGTVAVIGAMSLIPPVERQSPGSSQVVLVGAARDRMYGVFTADLQRPFGPDLWEDRGAHDSVYLPVEGDFFIEIPRGRSRLYLRGVVVMTNRGATSVETPVQISLQPDDEIVYVGHVYVQRTPPQWTQVREEAQAARAAAERSHGALAARRWTVRLARPLELGPSNDRGLQPVPLQAPRDSP